MVNWKVLAVSFIAVLIIYSFGGLFMNETQEEWFDSVRPSLTPPDWVFGVVWPVLYVLIFLSLYFAWTKSKKKQKKEVAWSYGINLVLNGLWTWIFFGLHLVGLAFIDLLLILGTGIWMFKVSWKIDRKAAWMLLPYLLWLVFAAILNVQSWLNL